MSRLQLSISAKLIGAFLAIAIIQLVFCLYGIRQLGVIGTYFDTAYTDAVQPLNQWTEFDFTVRDIETSLNRHVAEERPAVKQEIEAHVDRDLNTAAELLAKMEGGTLSVAERQRLAAEDEAGVDHSEIDFSKESNEMLIKLIRYQFELLQTLSEEAIGNSKQFMQEDAARVINTGEGLETFVLFQEIAEILRTRLDKKVASHRDQSLTLRSRVQTELIVGSLGSILFAVGIGIVISRGITRPVKDLVDVFKRLAVGQRVEKVVITRRDEVGLNVVMADNGKLALEKLETEHDIELVVMDIVMPVMDGYEAMRAIRAQRRFEKLPIVALTAKAMPEDRAKCLEAGANDYLTKPVDVERLLSLMRVWLFKREPISV